MENLQKQELQTQQSDSCVVIVNSCEEQQEATKEYQPPLRRQRSATDPAMPTRMSPNSPGWMPFSLADTPLVASTQAIGEEAKDEHHTLTLPSDFSQRSASMHVLDRSPTLQQGELDVFRSHEGTLGVDSVGTSETLQRQKSTLQRLQLIRKHSYGSTASSVHSPHTNISVYGRQQSRNSFQSMESVSSATAVRETNEMVKQIDPETGQKMINQYAIMNELGRGVYGKVKLCVDVETQQRYAVKIVHKKTKRKFGQKGGDPLEKIRKEIAIMKRCAHPNVVRLFEVIDDPNTEKIYLILEFVDGGELVWRDEETEQPVVDMSDVRLFFLHIVLGLEYLHYQGIIHRDIKPQNILVSKEKVAKIADFGVSFFSERANEHSQDQQALEEEEVFELSKTAGSPAFFAPELCMEEGDEQVAAVFDRLGNAGSAATLSSGHLAPNPTSPSNRSLTGLAESPAEIASVQQSLEKLALGKSSSKPELLVENGQPPLLSPVSANSSGPKLLGKPVDVWALGITLYCLVFGRLPFQARNEFELFTLIPKSPVYFPVETVRGDIVGADLELKDLINKLLEKDPAKRITLYDAKRHPWVRSALPGETQAEKDEWLALSDPEVYCKAEIDRAGADPAMYSSDGRILVTEDELEKAVTTGVVKRLIEAVSRRVSAWWQSSASLLSLHSNPDQKQPSALDNRRLSSKERRTTPTFWRRTSQNSSHSDKNYADLVEPPLSAPDATFASQEDGTSTPNSSHNHRRTISAPQGFMSFLKRKSQMNLTVTTSTELRTKSHTANLNSPLVSMSILPDVDSDQQTHSRPH